MFKIGKHTSLPYRSINSVLKFLPNKVQECFPKFLTMDRTFVRDSTPRHNRAYTEPVKRIYSRQTYDYFLVLDFEATCDKPRTPVPQEIIEFPVLKVNGKTFTTEAVFHKYVQPQVHKELSPFCIELTGIIQDMVNNQPHLEEVLEELNCWMQSEGLLSPGISSIFVTCGDWDLDTMLPSQCNYFNIAIPSYMKTWINIKKSFAEAHMSWPKSMKAMLEYYNLEHEGRLHSGIDDCKNIARILKTLAERGHIFSVNGQRR